MKKIIFYGFIFFLFAVLNSSFTSYIGHVNNSELFGYKAQAYDVSGPKDQQLVSVDGDKSSMYDVPGDEADGGGGGGGGARGGDETPKWLEIATGGATCEEILGNDLIEFLKRIFYIIIIIGLAITIIGGSMDFMKALTASKSDEELQKAFTKAKTRVLILVVLMLLPFLIEFLINTFGDAIGITNAHPFCG